MKKPRLVHGVGVNDSPTPVASYQMIQGRPKLIRICPIYVKWTSMLSRCYSKAYRSKRPAYEHVTVCTDWLRFTAFEQWAKSQDWEGNELDKDLLSTEALTYSPETACFMSLRLNRLITVRAGSNGVEFGVTRSAKDKKYTASHKDKFGNLVHLGRFSELKDARSRWFKYKLDLALAIAFEHKDPRIYPAVVKRLTSYGERHGLL